ncbi:acyltransferase family protein [Bacillus pumilus]|uniref:acyltransferase family protein n=1 Tax=Bacillus pumilus TaxID=1408 RepID=UPI001657B88D|nr:acyltransferase family protein [Bacillus pumilus]QNP15549.1 acyltransferase family protein [Bacillus pumilus]
MLEKDLKLSNIKGLLILLVVFGHLIELNKQNYYQFFVFIYAFHMPLFIFISGYLAKRVKLSKIINLFLLYIIFQSFFDWFLYFIGEYKTLSFHYGKPQFHLWYIVSMFFWYILAWGLSKLRLSVIGKLSIFIIMLIVCFMSRQYTGVIVDTVKDFYPNFTSYTLSYQRTISFAPFFFAGFFMTKDNLNAVYKFIKPTIAKVLLIATASLTILFIEYTPNLEWLFRGSFGIKRFLASDESYIIKMILHYLLSAWICWLILILVNSKKSILTKWGDYSLGIFLFHPVFVFLLRKTEFMNGWSADTQLISYLALSLVIVNILGSNFFAAISWFIAYPIKTIKKLKSLLKPISTN